MRTLAGRRDDRVGGASVKPETVVARVVPPACKECGLAGVQLGEFSVRVMTENVQPSVS